MRRINALPLAVRAAAHLIVDAVCASALYGSDTALVCFLIYDTLAFSAQPAAGMVCDRNRGRLSIISSGSCLLLAAVFFLPVSMTAKASAMGLANSFFHASAGSSVLQGSQDRAFPLGVFVAPGCIGLALGKLFPHLGGIFAVCSAVLAFILLLLPGGTEELTLSQVPERKEDMTAALMLFAAVAVRAFAANAVEFSWKKGAAGALLMTAAVFAGKFAGGFAADRMDIRKLSLCSIISAALLTAFCSGYPVPSLAGQFLINLTMPVTLWLMYRSLPGEPGFAFGLAAAALWPGALAGYLVKLTGTWQRICVTVCFLAGTAAISYSTGVLKKGEQKNG